MEAPNLTLYVRRGCDFCKDAEEILREAGLSYTRLWVARLCPGTITIWTDDHEHIATEPESMIPAMPALCARDRQPSPIFVGPEQIVLFAAGECMKRGDVSQAIEFLERFPAFSTGRTFSPVQPQQQPHSG